MFSEIFYNDPGLHQFFRAGRPRGETTEVDNFGQKMLNSGHSLAEARSNLVSGLKGCERKLKK